MTWSVELFSDWKKANNNTIIAQTPGTRASFPTSQKRTPPQDCDFKLNVVASVKAGSKPYDIGMILRDHPGGFVAGKIKCLRMVRTVFKFEALALQEGPHWLLSMLYQKVKVESYSPFSLSY